MLLKAPKSKMFASDLGIFARTSQKSKFKEASPWWSLMGPSKFPRSGKRQWLQKKAKSMIHIPKPALITCC